MMLGLSLLAAIVLPVEPTAVELRAAAELQDGLRRLTGREERIVHEPAVAPGMNFYVGATQKAADVAPTSWRYDEILVAPVADGVVFAGHPDRGVFYAVDTYLEQTCGVRWWTSTESFYPQLDRAPIPAEAIRHAPPIRYRETYFLDGYTNALFKVRSKGNFSSRTRFMYHDLEFVPKALGGDHRLLYYRGRGSAYHSFFEVLPPKRHFVAHPEWYSLIGGKREAKQLCLTNPEMTRAYIDETLRLLAEDPDVDFVSVSQNDWSGACECAACRAVVAEEGAASGLFLRFANTVAEAVEKRYPHVRIDTFAYRFTVKPPRHVRPRHNVVVRLCSIGSGVNEPYATRRLDDGFSDDLSAWAKIAPGRLFVWDYVVDFWSYMLPHPNLRSLAPNVRQFARNRVAGVFEQGDALCTAGSFVALKHWLLAHLLWNPDCDERRLMDDFVTGYYGPSAAPLIRDYLRLTEDAAARMAVRGEKLTCYHSNVTNFLSASEAHAARELMDRAIAAAETDGPDCVRRLRRERLSLDHAFLLNFDSWQEPGEKAKAVERWIDACREFGVEACRETVDRGEFAAYCERLRRAAHRPVE